MRDYLNLGPTPCSEDCVQVGTDNYPEKSREECRRYMNLLVQKFPGKPEGAEFKIKSFSHDFGTYREVCICYDDNNPEAMAYAFHVENNMPEMWIDDAAIPFNVQEYMEETE